jgi:thioredoxin reductase (NADPH)
MSQQYDVAVVGGGPAGYTAALYCVRAGFSTVVIEMLGAGGQMATTTQVDNYPGFDEGIDGFTLGEKMQAGAEKFGAVTQFSEVTALHLTENPKRIVTTDGEVLARAVVLATGASPKKLGLPDEQALSGAAWPTAPPATACSTRAGSRRSRAAATRPPARR